MLAIRDKEMGKVHMLVEKLRELANLFEMGEYHEVSFEYSDFKEPQFRKNESHRSGDIEPLCFSLTNISYKSDAE